MNLSATDQVGFIKRTYSPDAARAEAAGLRWLREGSSCVVDVLDVDGASITTEMVEVVRPTPEAAYHAGRELARIHASGAEAFGCPPAPDGHPWSGTNYIGSIPQRCDPTDDWAEFYTEQRVLPFVREAHGRGTVTTETVDLVERACAALRGHRWDLVPARVHGDLWAGNLLFGTTGPVFIDPAAHGGNPETDLAMLALFGAPHLGEIRRGYVEESGASPDFMVSTPIHQLHPLAVHALTHGSTYGRELHRTAGNVLRLLGESS
ncbi:fructosamine kinase family protein [Corynebacterium sp. CCM 9203]|uniref:fructosamine kinase family protein n=1 Tax=Corynebacterium sp. CCM 9203 TaxID=3057615 RepID=UPI003526B661